MSDRNTGRMIRFIMGRTHIATSYPEVAEMIDDRLAANYPDPDAEPNYKRRRARTITDALIQHRRNRENYAWVMGHH